MKPKRPTTRRQNTKASAVNESAGIYGSALPSVAPPALHEIAEKFGLRQETLSRLTGFSLRAVAGWASGRKPSAPVQRALTEMDRLLDSLARLMEPKQVGKWLKEPNSAFDGSTPVQVIERGQIDRIWRMLYFVESGEPG
jgi:DNA-binding transcriptional regulator YiaG